MKDGKTHCKTCAKGYQTTTFECKVCNSNCETYSAPGSCNCNSCKQGYYLDSATKSCRLCNNPNCINFITNMSCDCDKCTEGYKVDAKKKTCVKARLRLWLKITHLI